MTTPTTPEPGRPQGGPASGPEFRYDGDRPAEFRHAAPEFRQNRDLHAEFRHMAPLVPVVDIAPGDVIPGLGGELHEFDHWEPAPAPIYNPDPERAVASRVAVFRDGQRLTIGSPRVPVLRGGAR